MCPFVFVSFFACFLCCHLCIHLCASCRHRHPISTETRSNNVFARTQCMLFILVSLGHTVSDQQRMTGFLAVCEHPQKLWFWGNMANVQQNDNACSETVKMFLFLAALDWPDINYQSTNKHQHMLHHIAAALFNFPMFLLHCYHLEHYFPMLSACADRICSAPQQFPTINHCHFL